MHGGVRMQRDLPGANPRATRRQRHVNNHLVLHLPVRTPACPLTMRRCFTESDGHSQKQQTHRTEYALVQAATLRNLLEKCLGRLPTNLLRR